MNLGLFLPYPEQRVRLENISSVQGNIILCEKLKTNLCGKLRNNNCVRQSRFRVRILAMLMELL